jgi:hypothetical protein
VWTYGERNVGVDVRRAQRQLRLRPRLLTPVTNTDDSAGNRAVLGRWSSIFLASTNCWQNNSG